MRRSVQRRRERFARLDLALDDRAIRKREREPARGLVPPRMHAHELRTALPVEEPPVRVDKPEAAIAHDTRMAELHLVRIDDVQRLHRRDGDS